MAGTLVTDSVIALEVKSSTTTPPVFKNSAGAIAGTLCRAWVNFSASTPGSPRGSFNISSISKSTTGRFTVNFTTPMEDANYSVVASCASAAPAGATNAPLISAASDSSSAFSLATFQSQNVAASTDLLYNTAAVFR